MSCDDDSHCRFIDKQVQPDSKNKVPHGEFVLHDVKEFSLENNITVFIFINEIYNCGKSSIWGISITVLYIPVGNKITYSIQVMYIFPRRYNPVYEHNHPRLCISIEVIQLKQVDDNILSIE